MRIVYSPEHTKHDPKKEISDGQLTDAVEVPSRAKTVLARIEETGLGPVEPPKTFPQDALLRVHSVDYLNFLKEFWTEWRAEGRDGEAFPFVWPGRGLRRDKVPAHIDGRLGHYAFDAGSPMTEGTWDAALASAHVALTAADIVCGGDTSAFGLCRPPGHHAGRDTFGGYCFLNNAAIAAEHMLDKGCHAVTILDIDYHHGNGTQAIFEERSDVFFVSLHADPVMEYPFFLGYADETGRGAGEGFTANYPLPFGTDWPKYREALSHALDRIDKAGSDVLIVSLGLDTFEHDPISRFKLTSGDFLSLGAELDRVGMPTVFIFEGGYAVEELGVNCVNVLTGFEREAA